MADEESRNEDAKKRPGNSSKKDNEASGKKDDHKKDAKGKDADKADKKSSKASGGKSDKASKAEKSEKAVKTAGKKGSTKPKRRGPIGAVFGFLREVVEQLRKVVYPTRKELLTYTTVVLIFVAFMITVITLLDMGFSEVSQMIFGVE